MNRLQLADKNRALLEQTGPSLNRPLSLLPPLCHLKQTSLMSGVISQDNGVAPESSGREGDGRWQTGRALLIRGAGSQALLCLNSKRPVETPGVEESHKGLGLR